MEATDELSGFSIIAVGSFNPAIFQPQWFASKDLLPTNLVEHAETSVVVTPQLTAFIADWLQLQVTEDQASFSTVNTARARDLRDLARSILDLLPETPVDGIGLNSDSHWRVETEDGWHALGDKWLPKDFWEPLFDGGDWKRRGDGRAVGLRDLNIEVAREDEQGFVRVQVAPSVRVIPSGVYINVNSHFQLSTKDARGTGQQASRAIDEHWDGERENHESLISSLLDAA
jgi:hypothetical protein